MSNPESKTRCGTCHKMLLADAYEIHKKTGALYKTCRVCLLAARSTVPTKQERADLRDSTQLRQDMLAMLHSINDPRILNACCKYIMNQTQTTQNLMTGLPLLPINDKRYKAAAMSTANDATLATPSQILNPPV